MPRLVPGLAGAALVAAGAAVGVALERAWIGGHAHRLANLPKTRLGGLHGRPMTVVATDGTPLHVEVDEEGPTDLTVVFSHGYALNQGSWHYQREALRPHARLVFWDQRGHGESGHGPMAGLEQLGEDLRCVIEATSPDSPVVLVGHSMGGMTIMALAASDPDMFESHVRGVALLATAAGGISDVTLGLPRPVGALLQRIGPATLATLARNPGVVEAGRRSGSDLGMLLTQLYSFGSDVHPDTTRFVADMLAGTRLDVISEFLPALQAHDKLEALHALNQVEVLVMVGTADLLTPVARSEDIVRRVPGAEFVLLDGVGHMLTLERHDEVDAHLISLVERVRRYL